MCATIPAGRTSTWKAASKSSKLVEPSCIVAVKVYDSFDYAERELRRKFNYITYVLSRAIQAWGSGWGEKVDPLDMKHWGEIRPEISYSIDTKRWQVGGAQSRIAKIQ